MKGKAPVREINNQKSGRGAGTKKIRINQERGFHRPSRPSPVNSRKA